MIPYCKAHGIGLIPYWALNQGDLAKPLSETSPRKEGSKGTFFESHLTEADKTIINRVEEIAKKKGVSMAQISIAWSLSKDGASVHCAQYEPH